MENTAGHRVIIVHLPIVTQIFHSKEKGLYKVMIKT